MRRDKLLYQFTIAPGQIKIFHCKMEFVISLDRLGEGLLGSLVLSAGALEIVPNAPRCACGVLLHIAMDHVSAVAGGTSGLTCMVMILSCIFWTLLWLHQAGR